jgi:hypothetical protein
VGLINFKKMETIKKILVTLFLVALCFAGCDNAVNVKENMPGDKSFFEISLLATGQYVAEDCVVVTSINETAFISFDAYAVSDNTDYSSYISIDGWDGFNWVTLYALMGDVAINQSHQYSFINEYSKIRLYAKLFSDIPTTDTASLKITNISIQ